MMLTLLHWLYVFMYNRRARRRGEPEGSYELTENRFPVQRYNVHEPTLTRSAIDPQPTTQALESQRGA